MKFFSQLFTNKWFWIIAGSIVAIWILVGMYKQNAFAFAPTDNTNAPPTTSLTPGGAAGNIVIDTANPSNGGTISQAPQQPVGQAGS